MLAIIMGDRLEFSLKASNKILIYLAISPRTSYVLTCHTPCKHLVHTIRHLYWGLTYYLLWNWNHIHCSSSSACHNVLIRQIPLIMISFYNQGLEVHCTYRSWGCINLISFKCCLLFFMKLLMKPYLFNMSYNGACICVLHLPLHVIFVYINQYHTLFPYTTQPIHIYYH